jgi:uncharacterized membrane protein
VRIFGKAKENFFTKKEEKKIVSAIQLAELKTSGEIRVHLDEEQVEGIKERAVYIFDSLGMTKTKERNGILIYLNPNNKNFLVMGDQGIHAKVGQEFWEKISREMKAHFKNKAYTQGVIESVEAIGIELKKHYPYDAKTDTNELDDEVSYTV